MTCTVVASLAPIAYVPLPHERERKKVMTGSSNRDDKLPTIAKQGQPYFDANRRVLVIEDDKIMGQMVAEILRDSGFDVTTATNGMIAFNKLQHQEVDFIVLDILLPELDGFEIYSRLQADPETSEIPVLMITAWADERHIEKAARAGIRHFLAKPFTEDELLREILSLLRDREENKE
jgi:CheY-like chemotaxis protein